MRGPGHNAKIEDPSCTDIVLFIISIAQITNHDPGDGGVDKFIIAEIDADMCDCPAPPERMKKDQIALLQLIPADVPRRVILLFGGPWQRCEPIHR